MVLLVDVVDVVVVVVVVVIKSHPTVLLTSIVYRIAV